MNRKATILLILIWLCSASVFWLAPSQPSPSDRIQLAHDISAQLEAARAVELTAPWLTALGERIGLSESLILTAAGKQWNTALAEAERDPLAKHDDLCQVWFYRTLLALELSRYRLDAPKTTTASRVRPSCQRFSSILLQAYPDPSERTQKACVPIQPPLGRPWATTLVELRSAQSCGDVARSRVAQQEMAKRGTTRLRLVAVAFILKASLSCLGVALFAFSLWQVFRGRQSCTIGGTFSSDFDTGLGIFARVISAQTAFVIAGAALFFVLPIDYSQHFDLLPEILGLAVLIILIRRYGWSLSQTKEKLSLAEIAEWSVILFAAVQAGEYLIRLLLVGPSVPLLGKAMTETTIVAVISVSASVVLAPLFEEMTFRGVFYQSLRSRFLPSIAIVLSSTAFAFAHGARPLPEIALIAWFGIVLAVGFELTRSLWPLILCHGLYNGFSFVVRSTW